jgi:uncharacterized OB-fold protein
MKPIAEGLFTDETPPRLLGGRHRATGRIVFPCPRSEAFEPYGLRREGHIWSFTIQRFAPQSPPYAGPERFKPFAVAYVELADETIVEGRVENVDFDDLKIGMVVELIQVPLDPSSPDTSVLIHAFQPVGAERSQ